MKYTETHEWIEVKGDEGTVGISSHAQTELGEIVYVELPKTDQTVRAGEEVCVLESTKAAADVYSPVSGTIIAINEALKEDSGLINQAPQKEGWLYKIKLSQPQELESLLTEENYLALFQS